MAIIKPFKGYRPPGNLVEKIASKPYDVMNRAEAKEMAAGNEISFLRITRPELEFDDSVSAYAPEIYQRAKENFQKFANDGALVQDEAACFYIYRLVMGEVDQTGIVCVCGIDDYWNGVIKKHEYTRPLKEKDRITNIKVSGIQPGPVFSAYKNREDVDEFVETYRKENSPVYDFESEDKVLHQVWVVSQNEKVKKLESILKDVPEIYIADGHHRAASGSKVGLELREEKGLNEDAPYNYFLSVIFPHDQLSILDYNRLIKDLNGHTKEEFITALSQIFEVVEKGKAIFKPTRTRSYGMYLDGSWYELNLREAYDKQDDPVEKLDISLLDKYVLKALLDIQDQRTDKRIDFVGGIRGLGELQKRVDNGEMKIAFAIHPVSITELFDVADSGKVMPPKSTWFEPKLRSGLFVHQIN